MRRRGDVELAFSKSLPPLRGKARMGGICRRQTETGHRTWHRQLPENYGAALPTQSESFGHGYVCDNVAGSGFGDKYRSTPMLSTSPVFPKSWSSKWMADNMPSRLRRMRFARRGWNGTVFMSFASGTMMYWRTPTASCRQSNKHSWICRADSPPTLTLPRKGGGDNTGRMSSRSHA